MWGVLTHLLSRPHAREDAPPRPDDGDAASAAGALWPVAAHGFRRRQTLWVSVNLGSIVALLAMDVFVPPARPVTPSAIVRGMLTAGAGAQLLDLLWLAARGVPLPPRGIRPHVGISIGLNLLLAFGLAIASPVGLSR